MKKISIVAAITGNIVEWYDFALYIFLAPVLAHNFFVAQNHITAILLTFLVFALGFLVRPFGSILFGHFGDWFGRATTLKMTILLISIPTIAIGLLPDYEHWGIFASLAFAFCRLLQGLCIGGEFAGSMVYLCEMAHANRRAFVSCMANNGSNFGILCASLIAAVFSSCMSTQAFYNYGWRLPFIIGGVVGIIGLWLRRDLLETPVFESLSVKKHLRVIPLKIIFQKYKKAVAQIFLLFVFSATGSYVLMNFMSTYLHQYFNYSLSDALKIQSIYNTLTFLLVTVAARFSDCYGRRFMLTISAVGYIIFSVPCFYFLNLTGAWLCLLPLVIFYCIEQASTPVTAVEIFPAAARYTGLSLGYNLAMAIVGGTAPLVNTWLIAKFHHPLIIAYYLILGAIISLFIIIRHLPKQFGQACNVAESK